MQKVKFISLRNIFKSYDNRNFILEDFNLDIEEGSFVSILGSSGSGKSTVLNLIAGFIKPDSGKILLNGIDIKDISPNFRPTATVFQDYALFSHMNVFENIAFGLRKMFVDKESITEEDHKNISINCNIAIEKSNSKLKVLNLKVNQYKKEQLEVRKKREESSKGTFKHYYYKLKDKSYDAKINDLDYWKSYWEFYPTLQEEKFINKFAKRRLRKEEIKEKVNEIIELIGLKNKENCKHTDLSGGQQQRVALARAIITKPKILLLDEPLSALDEEVREKLQLELKRLHKQLGITFILITHNQKEALVLSDKIVILKKGKVEQIGTPSELYDSPVNSWVANFMGKANIFPATYLRSGVVLMGNSEFYTDVTKGFSFNEKCYVMIRPEDYDVVAPDKGLVTATVVGAIYKGQLWELRCKCLDEFIYVENIDEVTVGKEVGLVWDSEDVHVMKY